MHVREILITACLATMACSGPQTAPRPASDPPLPPPTATASVPTPAPAALPEPAAVATVEPVAPPSSLHIVLDKPLPMELSPLGNVGLLRVGNELLEVRDHAIRGELHRERGLPDLTTIAVRFAGSWPDNGFALVRENGGDPSRGEALYFWDGHRWKSKLRTNGGEVVADIARWSIRRDIALMRNDATGEARLQVVAGFPISGLPRSTKGQGDCPLRLQAVHMVARESGDVLVAGPLCPSDDGLGVERWEAKNRDGSIDVLPDAKSVTVTGLVAIDASRVLLGGRDERKKRPSPYFAHYDGATWHREPVPFADSIARLAARGPDAVWAVTNAGQLWKRTAPGAWERVHLPAINAGDKQVVPAAVSVWPHADGDLWVIGTYAASDGTNHGVVVHDRPLST